MCPSATGMLMTNSMLPW